MRYIWNFLNSRLFLVLVVLSCLYLLRFGFWSINNLWTFVNSNFVIAVITFAVGYLAYGQYTKQKEDHKSGVANTILLEIQNAERHIALAKRSSGPNHIPEDIVLMSTNSWEKNKHLFVNDLSRDEWDAVTEFYEKSRIYDDAVAYNKTFFQKNEEQIRVVFQGYNQEIVKELLKLEKENPDFEDNYKQSIEKLERFQDTFLRLPTDLVTYNPKKPINQANKALEDINDKLSLTTIGEKLRKIAKVD